MAWVEKRGQHSWRVRYFTDDGSIASISRFPTKTAAEEEANTIESDQRRGTWTDPAAGQTLLAEWVEEWLDALDVGQRTEENYRSKLRAQILPRWGDTALAAITSTKVHAWAKTLRHSGLADVTVTDTVKLLSLILADAADDKRIPANPIRPRRRGRGRRVRKPEKVWATPEQVIRVADQAAAYYGPGAGMLILTAGWSGARWGELVGLQRPNLRLDPVEKAHFVIDPDIGSLHESSSGRLWLGPPKTPESARTVSLPPFLVGLLRAHLDTHDHRHVFVTPDEELHRRSNFSRRAMRPSADGTTPAAHSRVRTEPVCPGLTFHGLRHSHKTWMIADGIPEVAQARRLGHQLPDKIQEIYSHVADEVETRLLTALQARWTIALLALHEYDHDTTWRHTA